MKDLGDISRKLEAILFVAGEPVAIAKLGRLSGASPTQVKGALINLKERLKKESGLRLLEARGLVEIATAAEYAPVVEKLFKSEHREELSRAALEVLAIVAYEGPVSRHEIELIRGVNSTYTIRNLLLRGLIEPEDNKKGVATHYDLSFKAQQKLGIESKEELPEWGSVRRAVSQARANLTTINETNS